MEANQANLASPFKTWVKQSRKTSDYIVEALVAKQPRLWLLRSILLLPKKIGR